MQGSTCEGVARQWSTCEAVARQWSTCEAEPGSGVHVRL